MRLSPVPLFFASDPKQAIHYASESSRTTHGTKAAVDACRYFAGLLIGALRGKPKAELLSPYFYPGDNPSFWNEDSLDPKIAAIAAGFFQEKGSTGDQRARAMSSSRSRRRFGHSIARPRSVRARS